MGPASEITMRHATTDPPLFDPSKDLQEWRRDVARWVDTLAAASRRGKDKHYQTLFATIGQQLYDRGLPSLQKSYVDEHQANGTIDYKQDDQLEAVRQIVELIAVDPPIAVVSRLISSFNKVTSCQRKPDEELNGFLSRFRGLASDHLLHGGMSASSQVGEVLAITLLNNARLSEETLTNAKLQLIALAQARSKEENHDSLTISKPLFHQLSERTDQLGGFKNHSCFQVVSEDSVETLQAKLETAKKKITRFHRKFQSLAENIADPDKLNLSATEKLLRPPPRCKLHLEDAVTVIRNLSFSPSNQHRAFSKAQVENIVGQRLQKALLTFSKSKKGRTVFDRLGSSSTRNAAPSKTSKGKSDGSNLDPKTRSPRTFCYDCGSTVHFRGDETCPEPSFISRKRRLDKLASSGNATPNKNSSQRTKKSRQNPKDNEVKEKDNKDSFPEGSNAAPSMPNHV